MNSADCLSGITVHSISAASKTRDFLTKILAGQWHLNINLINVCYI